MSFTEDGKETRKGVPGGGAPVYSDEGLSVQETAAVFANFEFLSNQEMDMDEIDDLDSKQAQLSQKQGKFTIYFFNVT